MKYNVRIDSYKERLEERIIERLAEKLSIPLSRAMPIYYSSRLARQIEDGNLGLENMDFKYLADDLIENEPELLSGHVLAPYQDAGEKDSLRVRNHPFFGSAPISDQSVDSVIDSLRGGRFDDI